MDDYSGFDFDPIDWVQNDQEGVFDFGSMFESAHQSLAAAQRTPENSSDLAPPSSVYNLSMNEAYSLPMMPTMAAPQLPASPYALAETPSAFHNIPPNGAQSMAMTRNLQPAPSTAYEGSAAAATQLAAPTESSTGITYVDPSERQDHEFVTVLVPASIFKSGLLKQGNSRFLNLADTTILDPSKSRFTSKDHARYEENVRWCQDKLKEVQPFRFFDLPGELRNAVYGFHFADILPQIDSGSTLSLHDFKLPEIAHASQKLHAETVPLFFANHPFHVYVQSNFSARKKLRPNKKSKRPTDTHGQIVMAAPRLELLKSLESKIVIKSITIKASRLDVPWFNKAIHESLVTSHIQLQVGTSGLSVTVTEGLDHENVKQPEKDYTYDVEDVDASAKAVQDKAEEMAARVEFKGFKWSDIQILADQLLFKKPKKEKKASQKASKVGKASNAENN